MSVKRMIERDAMRTNQNQSNLFLIDPDEATCKWIERVLGRDRYLIRWFPTVLSFLEQFDPLVAGCVLAEFNVRDGGVWDLVDVTQAEPPGIQLVFLANAINVSTAVELMKAGASDVLVRPVPDDMLHRSIERATAFDILHKRDFATRSVTLKHYTMLTPREREVFQLVVSGLPSKGIARVLERSQKTVEVHRTSIMKKMAAKSVVDLVRMGIELHVLEGHAGGAPWKSPPDPLVDGNIGGLPRGTQYSSRHARDGRN